MNNVSSNPIAGNAPAQWETPAQGNAVPYAMPLVGKMATGHPVDVPPPCDEGDESPSALEKLSRHINRQLDGTRSVYNQLVELTERLRGPSAPTAQPAPPNTKACGVLAVMKEDVDSIDRELCDIQRLINELYRLI